MKPEDREEQRRAALAQALRAGEESWTHELALIAFLAKITFARYEALVKAGFSTESALQLCLRKIEL